MNLYSYVFVLSADKHTSCILLITKSIKTVTFSLENRLDCPHSLPLQVPHCNQDFYFFRKGGKRILVDINITPQVL